MDPAVAANILKEAFQIQQEIATQRKALREKEALLQNLLWQLEKENVGRIGDYERMRKVVRRAFIVSREVPRQMAGRIRQDRKSNPEGCKRGRHPGGWAYGGLREH
jgi:hypothetical protein